MKSIITLFREFNFQIKNIDSTYDILLNWWNISAWSWYHIAISYDWTNIKLFIDWVEIDKKYMTLSSISDINWEFLIWKSMVPWYSQPFFNLDNFRITKWVSRFSSNFIIPKEIQSDKFTKLLVSTDLTDSSLQNNIINILPTIYWKQDLIVSDNYLFEPNLIFNWINSNIKFLSNSLLDFEDYLTVSIWVYVNKFPNSWNNYILNNSSLWKWFSLNYNIDHFEFKINQDDSLKVNSLPISTPWWYNVVWVFNKNILKIYINWVLSWTNNLWADYDIRNLGSELFIWSYSWWVNENFDWVIRDVKLYNYSLNEIQIFDNYDTDLDYIIICWNNSIISICKKLEKSVMIEILLMMIDVVVYVIMN